MEIKTEEFLKKLEKLKSPIKQNDFTNIANKIYFIDDKIMTWNGYIFISCSFNINSDKNFSLSYVELYKALQKINDKTIIVTINEGKLMISCKNTQIVLFVNEIYEELPIIENENYHNISSDFVDAIKLTKFCVCDNGIDSSGYINIYGNNFYATDTFRICRYQNKEKIKNMMLPLFSLNVLINFDICKYIISENYLIFSDNIYEIGVIKTEIKKLDFSKYDDIFNSDISDHTVIELPQEIIHNIELSEIFTDNSNKLKKEILVTFKKNNIIFTARNVNGFTESKFKFKNNLDLSFFIHPTFLMEILKISNVMEIRDDVIIFRNEYFFYFFRVRM